MKQCILVGNCQMSGIREFFKFSNFYEQYQCIQYANWQLIQNNKQIPIYTLKNADLVIYQPLTDVYGCYSTNKNNPDSFLNLLNENCNTISFPRIHNNGLFPIFHKNTKMLKQEMYGTIKNQVDNYAHLKYLYDNNLINFDFENRMNTNYEISKYKEQSCDVKIIDFIYKNIQNQKMFLTQDHPTSFIFNEIVRQICEIIDLDYNTNLANNCDENITNLKDSVYNKSNNQYPISRYSIKYFGFKYITKEDDDANNFYLNNAAKYIK